MRKILLSVFLLCTVFISAQDMRTVFINMPDSLMPLLTKVNREDFADFLESNMKAQVKNKFENTSEMKTLTKDYLLLSLTSRNTLEMKLLPASEAENILCVVNTVNGPVGDSSIRFFTTDWKELSSGDYISLPDVKDFFSINDTIDVTKQQIARSKADIDLIKATLSPDNNSLSFIYTTIEHMGKDDAIELKPYLKNGPVRYEWKNGRFIAS